MILRLHTHGKKKFCYGCGKELSFREFSIANPNMENKVEFFYSDILQFYCCTCFWKKTGKKRSEFQVYQNLEDFCEEEFFMSYEGEFE